MKAAVSGAGEPSVARLSPRTSGTDGMGVAGLVASPWNGQGA